jgi:hypothetical protein
MRAASLFVARMIHGFRHVTTNEKEYMIEIKGVSWS